MFCSDKGLKLETLDVLPLAMIKLFNSKVSKQNHSCSSSSSSSSSFTIPSFSLLGLDVIWVAFTVFNLLPYLMWCLTSSYLLPLPYSRFSLAYLLAFNLSDFQLPDTLLSMLFSSLPFTWTNQSQPVIFLNLAMFKVLHPTYSSDLFISNPVLPSYSWQAIVKYLIVTLAVPNCWEM